MHSCLLGRKKKHFFFKDTYNINNNNNNSNNNNDNDNENVINNQQK